jgi:hypothetical protein
MKKSHYKISVIVLFSLILAPEVIAQKRFDFKTIKPQFPHTFQSITLKDSILKSRDLLFRPQFDGQPIARNLFYEPSKDGKAKVLLLSNEMYKVHDALLLKSLEKNAK